MMNRFTISWLLLLGFSALETSSGTPISTYASKFLGNQVWSVRPDTEIQVKFLKQLEQHDEYDFWSHVHQNRTVDIMIPTERLNMLGGQFEQFGLYWTVKITDVGVFIEEQRLENDFLRKNGEMSWTAFHTYDEIVAWLQSLPGSYPGLATLDVIGKSYEGREIHVLKISKNDGKEKPALFFDATFHAREWITPATLTWVINEILTKPEHDTLLSKADLYFVPIVNPDGYAFSHTTNRMWRKTRNPNSGSPCIGTDPNRNMPFKFGGSGSSSSPCAEVYRGEYALSTPETKSLAEFVLDLQTKQKIHAYFSIHSAANMWLLNWNYDYGVYPEDFYTHLLPWGEASVKAIYDVHGTEYETGQGAHVIYPAAGVMHDWAKSIGIKYSTTLELRADYGFTPPPSEIIPTAEEMLAGFLVIQTTFE